MKLGKYIDNGTFSKVYETDEDKDKVIKVIKRYNYESDIEKKLLNHEINLSIKWPFENIKGLVKVFGVKKYEENKMVSKVEKWYIIMENGGENLERFIMRGNVRKMSNLDKIGLMIDLLEAVDKLEILGYRHFDIKPKNIVVNEDKDGILRAKMCDYDMLLPITMLDELGCEVIGTQRYLPPMDSLDRSLTRCIWSLGMVFYEIVYGKYFMGWKGSSAFKKDDEGVFDFLLQGMLNKDSCKRFNIKDCKYELQNLLVKIKSYWFLV